MRSSLGGLGTRSGICQFFLPTEAVVFMLLCIRGRRFTVIGPVVLLAPERAIAVHAFGGETISQEGN